MVPDLPPQLLANNGGQAMRAAIADPERYAIEPEVDGVRGLIVFQPDGTIEARNRNGEQRDWFRRGPFLPGLRAFGSATAEGVERHGPGR